MQFEFFETKVTHAPPDDRLHILLWKDHRRMDLLHTVTNVVTKESRLPAAFVKRFLNDSRGV
jgi:hypothetical protein